MLPVERHARIEQALKSAQVVGTEDMAKSLDVSLETVRRDFIVLEQQGLLERVHGGAMAPGPRFVAAEPSFVDRAVLATDGKAAMGAPPRPLWSSPGQTILMDVGTTVLAVARALPPTFRGTVATCSLLVAAELAGRDGIEVLVSGGRVRAGDLALSNAQTLAFFADLRADIAFLGSGGIDVGAGLTDFYLDEVATRRVLIANAATTYVLADRSKIGRIAPHRVCGIDAIDGIITDAAADEIARPVVERNRRCLPCGLGRVEPMTGAVLAIDQGTSGTKAIVVDPEDGLLAAVQVPVRPLYLPGGRVEQDPEQLLESVLDAGRQALAAAARPVETVSLANQGETVLAWDPLTGQPLSTAIGWQDGRAADICAQLVAAPPSGGPADRAGARPVLLGSEDDLDPPQPDHGGRRHHQRQLAGAPADRRVRHRCIDRQPLVVDGCRPCLLGRCLARSVRPGGREVAAARRV